MTEEIKLNKLERFIVRITPKPVKKFINWLLDKLPEKWSNWIRKNSFVSICIVYTIRGLFFRPTMWPIYAAIAAYFTVK